MTERRASRLRSQARALGVGFAASTLGALLFASQFTLISPRMQPQEVGFATALTGTLLYCYVWALLTIAIVPVARRFPIGQGRWRLGLAVLAAAGVGLSLVHVVVFATLAWLTLHSGASQSNFPGAERSWWAYCQVQFLTTIHTNIFVYAAILGLIHAIDYHRKYRDREIRASRLKEQLANAQLAALRMQLHPHFLFNTLNAIAALTREDPRAAERMIVRLSELLRMVLDNVGAQQHALRDELALLRKYLEIEQMRFGARLHVFERIEPGQLDVLVPTLILQPLVENAVRHGVSPRTETCTVEIAAAAHNGRLELVVRDTGPGLQPHGGHAPREGVGLANTRERLRQLYGEEQRFEVESLPDAGFEVRISIPRRHQADATPVGAARLVSRPPEVRA